MLLIYNWTGAGLVLAAGVVGFAAAHFIHPLAGVLGPLLANGVDLYLRRQHEDPEWTRFIRPGAGGHVFFVPVWVLAIMAMAGTVFGATRTPDPRKDALRAAAKVADTPAAEGTLEASIAQAVTAATDDKRAGASIIEKEDRVLVVVKLPTLRKFADTARDQLLEGVGQLVGERFPDKQVYIGIKGRVLFGAASSPAGLSNKSGADDLLLPFFGAPPEGG